jgi:hypothetical protein
VAGEVAGVAGDLDGGVLLGLGGLGISLGEMEMGDDVGNAGNADYECSDVI